MQRSDSDRCTKVQLCGSEGKACCEKCECFSPNLLWSCLVPCTVPLGKISSWKPVLQYSCLLRRIPLRWSKSVREPRRSLPSISPRRSFNPAGESDRGVFPSAVKLGKSRSMVPRNPPTSAMVPGVSVTRFRKSDSTCPRTSSASSTLPRYSKVADALLSSPISLFIHILPVHYQIGYSKTPSHAWPASLLLRAPICVPQINARDYKIFFFCHCSVPVSASCTYSLEQQRRVKRVHAEVWMRSCVTAPGPSARVCGEASKANTHIVVTSDRRGSPRIWTSHTTPMPCPSRAEAWRGRVFFFCFENQKNTHTKKKNPTWSDNAGLWVTSKAGICDIFPYFF